MKTDLLSALQVKKATSDGKPVVTLPLFRESHS